MTTMTGPELSVELTIRRAAAYDLIARCLAFPDSAAALAVREAATVAQPLLEGTPLERLATLAFDATAQQLEERYSRIFTFSTSVDCPTFETAYLSTDAGQQTHRMADINGFYRAFGVDTMGSGFRPDDICVELEFMGFLCRKQVYAAEHMGAPRVNQALRAQRMFLKEHLGRWGAPLGLRIARHAASDPFYSEVGHALHDWLEADCSLLKVGPIEKAGQPGMEWSDPNTDDVPESGRIIDSDDIVVM